MDRMHRPNAQSKDSGQASSQTGPGHIASVAKFKESKLFQKFIAKE